MDNANSEGVLSSRNFFDGLARLQIVCTSRNSLSVLKER
jgi:hypothetical protein